MLIYLLGVSDFALGILAMSEIENSKNGQFLDILCDDSVKTLLYLWYLLDQWSILICKKYIDTWKVPSGGRARIENLKVWAFFFIFAISALPFEVVFQ